MLLNTEIESTQNSYYEMLKATALISNLFSDSSSPYLNYRAVENIFCRALNAKNLSRSDVSADASKGNVGVGIKTFLNGNGKTLQKIAEFNRDRSLYIDKEPEEIVKVITDLRNERIRVTKRIHGLTEMIYHCVVREPRKIMIFETPMDEVNINNIKKINTNKQNIITFEDGINEYSINLSKSTLYKRFYTEPIFKSISVEILDNPYDLLKKIIKGEIDEELSFSKIINEKEHVFLPLFSDKGTRHVPERSGLNQWNASGRRRDYNEIYIPIPIWIHRIFPDFFPGIDKPFNLCLPNGKVLNTKVCQQNRKALMSNPNLALGKWLLRDVMGLNEGELLTYNKLEDIGLDSVVIYKENEQNYTIDFTRIGSYDEFKEQNI